MTEDEASSAIGKNTGFMGGGMSEQNLEILREISHHNLRFNFLLMVVMKSHELWDVMLCSLLKVNRRFGGTCHHNIQGQRISQAGNQRLLSATMVYCLAFSSTLKMEATCSSETSVDFQRTTRRYIPEDRTLYCVINK
jgi:hypothetical protein